MQPRGRFPGITVAGLYVFERPQVHCPAEGGGEIPVGTYSGTSNFPDNRANASDSDSDVIIVIHSITLTVDDDGNAHGDLQSECFTTRDEFSFHSDITGVISGQLLDSQGQLTVANTRHSYIAGTSLYRRDAVQ